MINKNVSIKGGFQRLRPSNPCRITDASRSTDLTSQMEIFIKRNGPFAFFITLTFKHQPPLAKMCKHLNSLFHFYNNKVFGREYNKKGEFHKGFCFIEDHRSHAFDGKFHMHILLISNVRYEKWEFARHESVFRECASKVKNGRGNHVFNQKYINFQPGGDTGRVDYCMKQVYDDQLNRVKFIGIDGISDNL